MSELKSKRAPAVSSNERAWAQVYDDINDIIRAVNNQSGVDRLNTASGKDGDIRLFKDVDRTKYFIEGRFGDGWAKRELIFSDTSDAGQDETINFSSTESYVKPDGTVPFTAAQTGVTPSNNNHLATKQYVDDNATDFSFTGDITGGSGSATIDATIADNAVENVMMANNSVNTSELVNNSVTYAKLQQINTDTFLGRDSAGTGNVEEITLGQLETMLNLGQYISSASTNTLTDMATSNPSAGHYLRHNGTAFVNTALVASDITGLQASQIPALTTSKIISGTFADGRISQSSVTQHIAAIKSTGNFMTGFDLHPDIAVTDQQIIKIVTQQGNYGTGTVSTSGNVHTITLNAQDTNTDTNRLTTFTLTADSGTNQTLIHGDTLDIEGGSAISTTVSSSGTTDKITINTTGNLPTLSGLSATTGNFIVGSSGTFTVQSGATARASLGLGSAATSNTSAFLASDATGTSSWAVSGALSGGSLTITGNINQSGTASKFYQNSSNTVSANSVLDIYNLASNGYGVFVRAGANSGNYCQTWRRYDNTNIMTLQGDGNLYVPGQVTIGHASQNPQKFTVWDGWQYMSAGYGFTWANGNATISESSYELKFATYSGSAVVERMRVKSNGNVHCDQDVIAYSTSIGSDRKLKRNIADTKYGLSDILKLRAVDFDWDRKHNNTHDVGFIAQEVETVIPELVKEREGLNDDDSFLTVDYAKLVPVLVKAIQEQQKQIKALQKTRKWI